MVGYYTGKLSNSKKRTLLVIAVSAGIGILLLAVVLVLYGAEPDSRKISAYMERKYKKDFEIIDEFTYISHTDGEPDTQRELECPAVILQDQENEEIRFFAFARPFGNGDWTYEDNYAQKILIYCIRQEQIEMENEAECGKTEAFAYPCLVLDNTDETAQKLQNMTIRFHELYQYNNSDHYNETFRVAGSMYLYSIEAGNISDRWLDETSPFCYDTPLEKYKAFLEELEEDFLNPEAPYIEAYYEFLQESIKGCSTADRKKARFSLAFIDDDEIPELLVMYDNFHAAGVQVYTYCNDAVADLGEFGSMGNMQYAEKEGMIESSFTGMGELSSSYYRMADGEALLICKIHSYPDYSQDDPYTNLLYEIDDVSVSKEEYDKKWKGFREAFDFIMIGYDDSVSIDGADLKNRLLAVRDEIEPKRGSKALQTQVSGQSEVLGAYGIFLDEYAKDWEDYEGERGPRFSLIYVNEDMIPELVIFDGMAHASFAKVYTYENGETVYIGDYGQYGGGTGYIEGEGIIISDYDNSGSFYTTIYQVDGANETVLQSYDEHWEFTGETKEDTYTYFIDGKEVSKEQYDAVSSEWKGLDEKIITYVMCSPILNADRDKALTKVLEDLILCQKTALKSRLLVESGMQEDEIQLFEYDDYNYDGKYEAFVFCGSCEEDEKGDLYSGSLWFVGTDVCVRLSEGNYRSIDKMYLGGDQKYICLNNDENQGAVKTEIWTVEDGEPVESPLSELDELTYDTYGGILGIWPDIYKKLG